MHFFVDFLIIFCVYDWPNPSFFLHTFCLFCHSDFFYAIHAILPQLFLNSAFAPQCCQLHSHLFLVSLSLVVFYLSPSSFIP